MGLDFSKEAARPPLSIACVAALSHIDDAQFRAFRKAIHTTRAPIPPLRRLHSTRLVAADHVDEPSDDHAADSLHAWRSYDLTLASFENALEQAEVASHDCKVLARMFTIMDRSGDEVVHSLELLVAIALLAQGSFLAKLELAVESLLEDLHDKPLTSMHVMFLVSTMTTVANYFGDPLLPLPELESIAEDVFQELQCAPEFDPHAPASGTKVATVVQALAMHPFVQEYTTQDRSVWSPRS